jgi:tetratricopeptide (TPR) repeat protein
MAKRMWHEKRFWPVATLVVMSCLWWADISSAVAIKGDSLPTPPPNFREMMEDVTVPGSDDLLLEALDLVNAGKYEAAIQKVRAHLQNKPESAPAYELLGAAQVLHGEIDEGLKSLKQAVHIDPRQSTAITKIGDVYLAQGDGKKAKEQFLKAVQIAPANNRAHQRLGILYEQEGNVNLAVEHYEKGIVETPAGYAGIKVNLAGLYNVTGRFEKAVALLEGLITPDSKDATAHFVLGNAYLGLKKTDKAIDEYTVVLKLEPLTERAPLALGIAYREQGNHAASVKEFEKVVKIKPSWPAGYYQMAETFLAMEQYDAALENYKKAQKLSTHPGGIQKRIAAVYLKQGKHQDAVNIYKDLKTKDPSMENYELLASAYQMSDQFDLAETTFKEMVRKFPDNPYPVYRLGVFYGYIKKYDQAIADLNKALAMSPEDPAILKALSIAYNQKGDRGHAIETARRITKLRPKSIPDKFYLAALTQDAHRDKEAIALYREILAEEPNHLLALNNLAVLLGDAGRSKEALQSSQKAMLLAPENGTILDTHGWILFKQNKYQDALAVLNKSLSLSPNNPVTMYHVAAVNNAVHNTQAAKENLEKALAGSSNFKGAEDARKLLKLLNGKDAPTQ